MNLEALIDSRKLVSLKTLLREKYISKQRAKKVLSDSPGLVNLAVGLATFVLNLPDGQVLFGGKFKLQQDCNQSC